MNNICTNKKLGCKFIGNLNLHECRYTRYTCENNDCGCKFIGNYKKYNLHFKTCPKFICIECEYFDNIFIINKNSDIYIPTIKNTDKTLFKINNDNGNVNDNNTTKSSIFEQTESSTNEYNKIEYSLHIITHIENYKLCIDYLIYYLFKITEYYYIIDNKVIHNNAVKFMDDKTTKIVSDIYDRILLLISYNSSYNYLYNYNPFIIKRGKYFTSKPQVCNIINCRNIAFRAHVTNTKIYYKCKQCFLLSSEVESIVNNNKIFKFKSTNNRPCDCWDCHSSYTTFGDVINLRKVDGHFNRFGIECDVKHSLKKNHTDIFLINSNLLFIKETYTKLIKFVAITDYIDNNSDNDDSD